MQHIAYTSWWLCALGVVAFKRQTNLKINNCVSADSIQGVPAARLERWIPSAALQFDLIKLHIEREKAKENSLPMQPANKANWLLWQDTMLARRTHIYTQTQRQVQAHTDTGTKVAVAGGKFIPNRVLICIRVRPAAILLLVRLEAAAVDKLIKFSDSVGGSGRNTHTQRAQGRTVLAVTSLGRKRRLQPFIDS